MDVPMRLSRILIAEHSDQQMIFLKEVDGDRTFPILIGINEAMAIDRRLKGHTLARPMTHELLASVIEEMGGRLVRIVINDLVDHTFIATLHIECDGEVLEIDSRPSDAIALGVAFDTPIFVADHVLEAVLRGPSTKNERVQILRDRLAMLAGQVADLTAKLEDEKFVGQQAPERLDELREHLKSMTNEHDAIKRVLDNLG